MLFSALQWICLEVLDIKDGYETLHTPRRAMGVSGSECLKCNNFCLYLLRSVHKLNCSFASDYLLFNPFFFNRLSSP